MARWEERRVDAVDIDALVAAGYTPLQARLLAVRGVSAAEAAAFFAPSLVDLARPADLPGVADAVQTILRHVRARARIVVFGDYDCDGVCATAILVKALAAVGAHVAPLIPERLTEGYGMTAASIARLLAEFPDVRLVITVDNGINAVREVADFAAKGIDVVVTDHHLPGDELPACPIVNPKVAAPPSLESLCGAGVAFLLAKELLDAAKAEGRYTGPKVGGELLVLAGLATVTDIMPLTGQNRLLVSEALARFHAWAPTGLKELYARASRAAQPKLTAKDFGFLLGPRINAAGRMASGIESLNLILAGEREAARRLALTVDLHNTERKSIEQQMTNAALEQIEPDAPAQVIALEGAHQGVAGIVASRILEKLKPDHAVPVAIAVDGHGSARAPEGYNVRDAFVASAVALTRYGGHAAAGGFSVREGAFDEFKRLFRAACAGQRAARACDAKGVDYVDAWVTGRDLTLDFAEWVQTLEPFGEGNPEPVFGLKGVYLSEARQLGADGRHLQVCFYSSDVPRGVWWNHGTLAEELHRNAAHPFDVRFTIEISAYGEPHVELRLVDLRVQD